MKKDGKEGTIISRAVAKQMTDLYKASPAYQSLGQQEGIYFGKENLLKILNQPGCVGLRIFYGVTLPPDNKPNMILVGTDEDSNNIFKEDLILDLGIPCPDDCPDNKF